MARSKYSVGLASSEMAAMRPMDDEDAVSGDSMYRDYERYRARLFRRFVRK